MSGACFETATHTTLTGLSDMHDYTSNNDCDSGSDDSDVDGSMNEGSKHWQR